MEEKEVVDGEEAEAEEELEEEAEEDEKVEVEEVVSVEVRVLEERVAVMVVTMSVRVVMPPARALDEGVVVCWDG